MLKKTLSWVMVGMLFLSLVFNENLVTKKIDAAEIKNEYVVYDGNKVIGVKKMSVNESKFQMEQSNYKYQRTSR